MTPNGQSCLLEVLPWVQKLSPSSANLREGCRSAVPGEGTQTPRLFRGEAVLLTAYTHPLPAWSLSGNDGRSWGQVTHATLLSGGCRGLVSAGPQAVRPSWQGLRDQGADNSLWRPTASSREEKMWLLRVRLTNNEVPLRELMYSKASEREDLEKKVEADQQQRQNAKCLPA